MYSRMLGIHGTISAALTVAIIGLTALVLDRSYLESAPAGIVEIGKLTPVEANVLDAVVVRGKRQV
jgi:hypothetical protein